MADNPRPARKSITFKELSHSKPTSDRLME